MTRKLHGVTHRTRLILIGAVGAVLVLVGGLAASAQVVDGSTPSIASDRTDYAPGSTVVLTGAGWSGDLTVSITVDDDQGRNWYYNDQVAVAVDGSITDSLQLPSTFVAKYNVLAKGAQTSREAVTSFTDSSADLDQCGNGPSTAPQGCDTSNDWQNGNLNAQQAHYNEGEFVPYRYKLDGLALVDNVGDPVAHTIVISWDTTDNGKHGLDYIGSYDATETTANPCAGVLAPAICDPDVPSTYSIGTIPSDPRVKAGPDGTIGTADDITQIPGAVTLFGGQITNVGCPTSITGVTCPLLQGQTDQYSLRTGSYTTGTGYSDNTITAVQVSFTADISNPILAVGGHISRRIEWSPEPTASLINGSPYHMRLQGEGNKGGGLDGSGGSQDRSLSADAVTAPASITIIKNTLGGVDGTFDFTTTGTAYPNNPGFSITTLNGTGSYPNSNILIFGSNTVTESGPSSAWSFVDLACTVNFAGGGQGTTATPSSASTSTKTATINLTEGGDVTCTYRNQPAQAKLTLVKRVVNDDGGTKTVDDFNPTTSAGSVTFGAGVSDGADTLKYTSNKLTVSAGAYSLSELDIAGYAEGTWGCTTGGTVSDSGFNTGSVTLAAGADVTCTITNDDSPAKLTLVKRVVNDDGGDKTVSDFNLLTSAGTLTPFSAGVADGTDTLKYTSTQITDLNAGAYTLREDNIAGYSEGTWTCTTGGNVTNNTISAGSVTLANGADVTCTITNDDSPAKLTLVKRVVNDDGGDKTVSDFNLLTSAGTLTPFSAGVADGTDTLKYTSTQITDLNAGAYTLREDNIAGYSEGTWTCTTGGNVTNNTISAGSVTLANGADVTCTITNDDSPAKLTLVKRVVNNNGGTATVSAFGINTTAGSLNFDAGVDDGTNTKKYTADTLTGLSASSYTLKESNVFGYTEGSWECTGTGGSNVTSTFNNGSVTLANDADVTCKITNNDDPATIVIQKNATPATGVFTFTTTGSTSGSGTSWPSGAAPANQFTLNGDPAGGGNVKSFAVDAGSYSVTEKTQLGWLLTAIGGAGEPTPTLCKVEGSGGSSSTTDFTTGVANITIKNGDTVTCIFENTGVGATRTQGFWATHPQLADIAWNGGSFINPKTGQILHTFPGVASLSYIGDRKICGRDVNSVLPDPITRTNQLMGGFWSDVAKKSTGAKRQSIDQARMQLLQQLLAAELNTSAFGSVPTGGTAKFNEWENKLCNGSATEIKKAQQEAASFNTKGDSATFTPGMAADSKYARAIADLLFWDIIKP